MRWMNRHGSKGALNPRRVAKDVLVRVIEKGAFADVVLDRALAGLKDDDKRLATEIVYGVLRNLGRLDFVIDAFSSIKIARLEAEVLTALRIGVYQLLFLTRVPPRAAISETVELIKGGGAKRAGFVNAVLRKVDAEKEDVEYPRPGKDPVRSISVFYSHPEWLVKRWIGRFGVSGTTGLCKVNLEPPPKTLRANTLVNSRDRLMEELASEGLGVSPCAFSPAGIIAAGSSKGLSRTDPRFYIQEEASQLIPLLLSPAPGAFVLDACSAPGGKTAHLAALMDNRGAVIALDRHLGRLKRVKEWAERFNARIIRPVLADASLPLPFKKGVMFDSILLDAPCSGLGVIRRSPDIKLRRTPEDLEDLKTRQLELMNNLSLYLKEDGSFVYSVCTFEGEETDEVMAAFLESNPGFRVEDASSFLPPSSAALVDKGGFLRTFPHRDGLDGFFAARLRRRRV